jgi:hypothetical protein
VTFRRAARAGIALAAFSLAATWAAAEQSPDTSALSSIDDPAFDSRFQCPGALASDDDRIDEYQRYLAWSRVRHPDWSFKKRMDVRYGLLRRHGCAATLRNIGSSAMPAFPPAPPPAVHHP